MRRALALVAVFFLSQISAQAADTTEKVVAALNDTGQFLHTLVREPPPLLPGSVSPAAQVAWSVERPSSFPVLSMTFQALSGLDWYTTSRALKNGREANPMLAPIAGYPVALLAAKSAAAAATVYVAERLWKRNHAAAIAVMIAADVVTASAVAHNASLSRALRN
jgi:hypothetical protein